MKIELDSEDLAIIGGAICVALLIYAMAGCEYLANQRAKAAVELERAKAK